MIEKSEPGQDYQDSGRTTPYFPFSQHFAGHDYVYVDYNYDEYSHYPTPTPFTTPRYNNK